ncbi:MAG: hypothetical protein EA424_22515 [Planctomycetaceae bacterium]|nr:MAG: hypothetical protein EA424_22515 [Planctomycetaceae bacterium]
MAGIDRQKYDFDDAGFWSYLRGEWRDRGWWYYYLYGLAVKEPVGTWLLVLLALVASLVAVGKGPGWRDELLVLAPVVTVLVLVSSQTGFNHHLRYVLPMYPFAFIWISRAARLVNRKTPLWGLLVVASLTWSVGSSLRHYPHSLSYFNELVGGPRYGHDHLLDSNIDWGQDLLLLKRWVDRHPEARPLGVAYSLPGWIIDMDDMGIPAVPVPRGPLPDGTAPPSPEETGPLPGWYAIFVRELRERHGWYAYFRHFEPVAMVGYTVYIYHITPEDANRVRRELGLAELPFGDRSEETGKTTSVGFGRMVGTGFGSRCRATINHVASGLPENDSRPLPRNATQVHLPILTRSPAATRVGWVSDPTRSEQSPNLQRCAHRAPILRRKTLTAAPADRDAGAGL